MYKWHLRILSEVKRYLHIFFFFRALYVGEKRRNRISLKIFPIMLAVARYFVHVGLGETFFFFFLLI